jgi:hypothetical protein
VLGGWFALMARDVQHALRGAGMLCGVVALG